MPAFREKGRAPFFGVVGGDSPAVWWQWPLDTISLILEFTSEVFRFFNFFPHLRVFIAQVPQAPYPKESKKKEKQNSVFFSDSPR